MAAPLTEFQATLAEHRRRLARLVDQRAAGRMKKLYSEAQSEITARLHRFGKSSEKFTAHQQRILQAQVRQGQALAAKRLAGEMGDISREAQTEALRGLSKSITKMERTFTGAEVVLPIDEAARFRGIIDGRRLSLLRAHQESMSNYGAHLITKMEDQLSLSLVVGDDFGSAVDRVAGAAEVEWWKGEQIVRTETIGAFNATQHDGIIAAAEELPDLMMRWTENVDDSTGQPLDSRVADDSLAMHGQVAPPHGSFEFPTTLPDGSPVSKRSMHLIGKSWQFPPNRPNDRSSLSPWRPGWGIPGWQLIGGSRVFL